MRAVKLSKFITEEEKISWLIEGLLPETGWTLLIGRRGLGKTTFALQLGLAIQGGTEFLGMPVKQGNVLYLQADSPTEEWREIIRGRFTGQEMVTVVDVENRCLDNPIYVEDLRKIVDRFKPALVVFDSLYNLTGKNINSDQVLQAIAAMKSVCQRVEQDRTVQIPFILIHHPPQGETRASGHNSLEGNCSNLWYLLKSRLKIEKSRLKKGVDVLMSRREDNGLWELTGQKDSLTDRLKGFGVFE
jgi:RecA-family ATPase